MIEVKDAQMLADDELDKIVGGVGQPLKMRRHKKTQHMAVNCQKCNKNIVVNILDSQCKCPLCGGMNYFVG